MNLEYKIEEDFVFQPMITYIGNKRKLVNNIFDIVNNLRKNLNKDKLNIVDGFTGSVVVSRSFSSIANKCFSNDLETYSYLMAKCFLNRPTPIQITKIENHIETMNKIAKEGPFTEGIICSNYAPKITNDIKEGERCFYTRENALIIDTLRKYIEENVEPELFSYCIVPLLIKASIHTNTAGVFKGFYKKDNIGCFGGKGENALSRIMKPIELDIPKWSLYNFEVECHNKDINDFVKELPNDIDLIYLDLPFNQHPYGSNYFMLNVIINNQVPNEISKVSGIPTNWKKCNYNHYKTAIDAMTELIKNSLDKSKYLLISYNNEGIIPVEDWNNIFKDYQVEKYEINYDTYKGCRNLNKRNNKVIEIMYLISNN